MEGTRRLYSIIGKLCNIKTKKIHIKQKVKKKEGDNKRNSKSWMDSQSELYS